MHKARLLIIVVLLIMQCSCVSIINMQLYPQETGYWCWAACGRTCMKEVCRHRAPSQCKQAQDLADRTTTRPVDCCNLSGLPFECRQGGYPDFYSYGYKCDSMDVPLSWSAIRNEIRNNRPVTFIKGISPEDSHMWVVYGFDDASMNLLAFNPLPVNTGGNEIMTYSEYCDEHLRVYYNIKKRGFRCLTGYLLNIF